MLGEIPTNLYEYFMQNWKREPYSVIDHSLRIDLQPDGRFHFYIHPSNTDGVTTDFICGTDGRLYFPIERHGAQNERNSEPTDTV